VEEKKPKKPAAKSMMGALRERADESSSEFRQLSLLSVFSNH
jgi:hypothetical protein